MNDDSILARISALVDEEHHLRDTAGQPEEVEQRLRHVSEQLDQCWDLLRQRRARREFGEDPGGSAARPVTEVEEYLQ